MADSPDLDAPARTLVAAIEADATQTLGARASTDALMRQSYDQLHRLARMHRARWNGNDTMNTTALVSEAYLKLTGSKGFANEAHFLAVAGRAMRQVLVNYAEHRRAQKRGGGVAPVSLDDAPPDALLDDAQSESVLGLHEALGRLARIDERGARVVEARFFGGMSLVETAEALGVSEATVTRAWRRARAWLRGELEDDLPQDVPTLVLDRGGSGAG